MKRSVFMTARPRNQARDLGPFLKGGLIVCKTEAAISPDTGGVKLALGYGSKLDCRFAVLQKERLNGAKAIVNKVVGEVRGKRCVIIDDMISTGSTIKNAVDALLQAGANECMTAAAAHPVFTTGAKENPNLPAIQQIIAIDSIPVFDADSSRNRGAKTVSLAPILAEAIHRGK